MSESATDTDLDLNALADIWMGSPAEEESTEETAAPDGEGGGETQPPEAPNGDPTPQFQITQEMEDEIFQRRLSGQLARAREAKAEKDLQNLLATGTDEQVAAYTRQQIAETQARHEREAFESQARGRGALEVIDALVDDAFVALLTPEEAASLLPENFEGKTDREYIKAIQDMKVAKARSGTFDESEVERRVQERLKTNQNVQRGQQFSQSSPTMTPAATATEDRHAGKEGAELKDSLWAHAMEDAGWNRDE